MNKITTYIRNHRIISAIIVVAAVGIVYFGYKKSHAAVTLRYVTQPATTQTITVAVTGSGQVAATDQVDLKPQSSGQIKSLPVKQGQQLKAGQTVAIIDQTNTANQIQQAKASLDAAQANYDKVVAGTTSDDLHLANLSVSFAQQALDNAKTNYTTVQNQQKTDIANTYTDLLNSNL